MANAVGSTVRTIWWLVLIRGILLVLLGALTVWQPATAVVVIVLVFGIYAIVDGIAVIVAGIAGRKRYPNWGWLIVQGALAIVAGALILLLPGLIGLVGLFVLLWFLVFSLIVGGILTLVSAAREPKGSKAWGFVAGVLDILFGILIGVLAVLAPLGTVAAMILVVAIAAIVFGIVLIVSAFVVRRDAIAVADSIDEALAGA